MNVHHLSDVPWMTTQFKVAFADTPREEKSNTLDKYFVKQPHLENDKIIQKNKTVPDLLNLKFIFLKFIYLQLNSKMFIYHFMPTNYPDLIVKVNISFKPHCDLFRN